jgi:hypothetical protein
MVPSGAPRRGKAVPVAFSVDGAGFNGATENGAGIYGDASHLPRQVEQAVIQPSKAVSYALHANFRSGARSARADRLKFAPSRSSRCPRKDTASVLLRRRESRHDVAMSEKSRLNGIASLLLEKHGIRAASAAQHEALRARQNGDIERAEEWAEVARLIDGALASDL